MISSLSFCIKYGDVPIKLEIERLDKLKECYPRMINIWKRIAASIAGSDEIIQKYLEYYEDVTRKYESG